MPRLRTATPATEPHSTWFALSPRQAPTGCSKSAEPLSLAAPLPSQPDHVPAFILLAALSFHRLCTLPIGQGRGGALETRRRFLIPVRKTPPASRDRLRPGSAPKPEHRRAAGGRAQGLEREAKPGETSAAQPSPAHRGRLSRSPDSVRRRRQGPGSCRELAKEAHA